ncbi:hypothetical protein LEP1GSC047_1621 [Leptospira inadai serovar Lyme str. 10]|uniref:Uncharacterized protein n=1 Tax=Leptospira inadai serovar Lyme str. 10 TaxID=1049790 RepID=V6HRG9_9LEPT|nr:hypothetical protein [Leptospira inadai]EQA35119.1 hypothetical protein LEP1GSC047_1621 [Leptospira inadai serovar Lyme str. 10]
MDAPAYPFFSTQLHKVTGLNLLFFQEEWSIPEVAYREESNLNPYQGS